MDWVYLFLFCLASTWDTDIPKFIEQCSRFVSVTKDSKYCFNPDKGNNFCIYGRGPQKYAFAFAYVIHLFLFIIFFLKSCISNLDFCYPTIMRSEEKAHKACEFVCRSRNCSYLSVCENVCLCGEFVYFFTLTIFTLCIFSLFLLPILFF